jgi:hypothetical protein
MVQVALGVADHLGVASEGEAIQDNRAGLAHRCLRLGHDVIDFVHRPLDEQGVMHWAQTAMPLSVARQQARRSISAPLACMGKFRRLLGLASVPTWTPQPKPVCR